MAIKLVLVCLILLIALLIAVKVIISLRKKLEETEKAFEASQRIIDNEREKQNVKKNLHTGDKSADVANSVNILQNFADGSRQS